MRVDGGVGWDGLGAVGLAAALGAAARMSRRMKWSWGSGPCSSINCEVTRKGEWTESGRCECERATDCSDFVPVFVDVLLGEGAEEEDDLSLGREREVSSRIWTLGE